MLPYLYQGSDVMQIIILGSGQLSLTLASALSKQNHDVVLVDEDVDKLQAIKKKCDISIVIGRPSYPDVLRDANAKETDVLIAVCENDELNMVACQVAYSLFDIPCKIAHIRSPHYFFRNELFGDHNLPIDVFINPEKLVSQFMISLIEFPSSTYMLKFFNDQLRVVGIEISKDSELLKVNIKPMSMQLGDSWIKPIAVYRKEQYISIKKIRHLKPNDEFYFSIEASHIDVFFTWLNQDEAFSSDNIMIGGGGHIGYYLADHLSDQYNVKVIERDLHRCNYLSQKLPKATILQGDVVDKDLISSENINDVSVYCAVSDDDHANILSSLQAKYLGANKVMTILNQKNYVDILQKDKKHLTIHPEDFSIAAILSHISGDGVEKVALLKRGHASVYEITVPEASSFIDKKITTIESDSVVVAAIKRAEKIIIPDVNACILKGDVLLMFLVKDLEKPVIEKIRGLKLKRFFNI
jgi:trk system potassium uptake protein